MSTKIERNDEEMKLSTSISENDSPEMETSIWYN